MMKKRLIAFLLVLIMVLGMLPVSALAADGDATRYTYHLIHEFNYVGGTRWDIMATTAAESYQIDVNKGKPTRDRYKFDGWADTANATTATYFGGELITLTKDSPTKTIYAVWKPIFELHYNANGGTGAPNSQTYTSFSATSTQATFTIPNQIPTKDGYTFKGWADSAAATTAQYQPGDTVDVKHENSPKTIYAVWESMTPPTDKPGKPDMNQFLGNVLIRCTTDGSTHAEKGRKNIYSNTRDSSMYTEVRMVTVTRSGRIMAASGHTRSSLSEPSSSKPTAKISLSTTRTLTRPRMKKTSLRGSTETVHGNSSSCLVTPRSPLLSKSNAPRRL